MDRTSHMQTTLEAPWIVGNTPMGPFLKHPTIIIVEPPSERGGQSC
ncbi:hypothetical protein RRSWK_00016 [Rhodopirellula sp. SWK7]|nr:hypothetical protein RRSWK_00016 [Rhodopirellula sp. SWK7]